MTNVQIATAPADVSASARILTGTSRVERMVNVVLRLLAMALVLVLCVIMCLQVFQRFVLGHSLDWPDELAPTLLAWITFVGAALAARDNEHVAFPLLIEWLPPRMAALVGLIGAVIVVALLGVYTWFSFPLILQTWDQSLTTIDLSRGLLYVVLPVSSLVMIFYVVQQSPLGNWLRRRAAPADLAPILNSEE